jgi:hypothetical protein
MSESHLQKCKIDMNQYLLIFGLKWLNVIVSEIYSERRQAVRGGKNNKEVSQD